MNWKWNVQMDQFDCLKRERVINTKSMLSDEKTAFMCTPTLSSTSESTVELNYSVIRSTQTAIRFGT